MSEYLDVEKFKLILLPGKCPPEMYKKHYVETYDCWRKTWEFAYKNELNENSFLFSDDFTRQDEIAALFYGDECAAICFFRWVDFDEGPAEHDSYFEVWPEMARHKLCREGRKVLVGSQFTLNFKYRKMVEEVHIKDLFAGLVVRRFLLTDRDVMTGTMRISKGMNTTSYNSGAQPILQNVQHTCNQEPIDLVAFYRSSINGSTVPGVNELVDRIFSKTISLVHPLGVHQEVKRAA